jgi:hypothetical protein
MLNAPYVMLNAPYVMLNGVKHLRLLDIPATSFYSRLMSC